MTAPLEISPSAFLDQLIEEALKAADPYDKVIANLPSKPEGRVYVAAFGKAAARMAKAVEDTWGTDTPGTVIVPMGYAADLYYMSVVEGGHPTPSKIGLDATKMLVDDISDLKAKDMLLVLVSGGGSSLLCKPAEGIELDDLTDASEALVASGEPISEINKVRMAISTVKAGRLAVLANPAKVVALVVSDVAGDDVKTIASAPTEHVETSRKEALEIFKRNDIMVPSNIYHFLHEDDEERKVGKSETKVILNGSDVLDSVKSWASAQGVKVVSLGASVEGDSRKLAIAHAKEAKKHQGKGPVLILSGGEATVKLEGRGHGGPNSEYALALALELDGAEGIYAISIDTDGMDGNSGCAGARIAPDTMRRAMEGGLQATMFQNSNDTALFFKQLGDAIETGPTRTNVNDLRAILVL